MRQPEGGGEARLPPPFSLRRDGECRFIFGFFHAAVIMIP